MSSGAAARILATVERDLAEAIPIAGDEVADEELSPADLLEANLITFDAMENRPPPTYVIDRTLTANSLAAIYGPSGSGKTFVEIDLLGHVASNAHWQGRAVSGGPVLLVAAEGVGGLPKRVAAWKKANRIHSVSRFVIYPAAVNLLEPQKVDALVEVCRRRLFVMVVIDTVARSMVGGDENSAQDMGRLIEAADRVRRASGACVLLVHHTGKDTGAGMRGSSALLGAVDTAIEVKGGEGQLELVCRKQKDDAEFAPIHLSLTPVEVTVGGVETTSCVVTGTSRTNWVPPVRVEEARAVVVQLMSSSGLSRADVRGAIEERLSVGKTTAYDTINALVSAGVLINTGTEQRPFYVLGAQP